MPDYKYGIHIYCTYYMTYCVCIDLSEGACPVGQERSEHCSLGCEDYQSDVPTANSSGRCGGCSCPVGLVRYRDRCVDPRECYSLFMGEFM